MIKKQLLLTTIIFISLLLIPIWKYRSTFFTATDIAKYAKLYAHSQYVLGEASVQKIDDETLYVYAGFAYLQGEDPTTINFEHPPLGKYLFGLSYWLFHNAMLLNLIIYAGVLWLTYQLANKLLTNQNLAITAMVLVGGMKIFQIHTSHALLDLQQLVTLSFFWVLFSTHTKKFFWSSFLLGVLASIKYPFPLVGIFILILAWWAAGEKQWKKFIFSLPVMLIPYLLSYLVHFWYQPNPLEFLKFEWFRWRWWTGERTMPKFLIFQTLFRGKFMAWWAEGVFEQANSWTIFWPVIFIGQLFSLGWWRQANQCILTIFVFANGLLLLYAFGAAANERYLIQLFPFWIILSLWGGKRLMAVVQKKRLAPNKPHGIEPKQL